MQIDAFLEAVSNDIRASVAETSAGNVGFDARLLSGKRVRSRMAFHVGLNVPRAECVAVAAAVELFHTASLLHDDVIDGASVRRGVPADWRERGAAASILLGDRFLVQALLMLTGRAPRTVEGFLRKIGELCDAEMEHESLIGTPAPPLAQLLNIARRKTGSLFAFIGLACAGPNPSLAAALESCGYAIGVAYQLLDDTWDTLQPAHAALSKTLGSDTHRGKPTLTSPGCSDVQQRVASDLELATQRLSPWPTVERGWHCYLTEMRALAGSCGKAFG